MRPRSRLLSKRRLLPTIKEGTEEMVRDLNEANALHASSAHCQSLSSEDYLLSICHLAHPTFPSRDSSSDNSGTHPLDAQHHKLRLWRSVSESTSTTPEQAHAINVQEREGKGWSRELLFGCHSNSDPLEYLYGHQNGPELSACQSGDARRAFLERRIMRQNGGVQARSRAHSIPRVSSPDLTCRRKSSCPELHTSTHPIFQDASPKHSLEEARGGTTDGDKHIPTVKHSAISQWISDCRSAWREARGRACLLPAIAEI